MRTNVFEGFEAISVLNSIMVSSYVDNDNVIQEDSKQERRDVYIARRQKAS